MPVPRPAGHERPARIGPSRLNPRWTGRLAVAAALGLLSVLVGNHLATAMAAAGTAPARTVAVTILTQDGPESITAEVACTLAERARGLMGRKSLAPDAGMIFLVPAPRLLNMWMRDTPLSLDMIFFDKDHKIIKIEGKAEILSERVISSDRPAMGVIELPAGQIEKRKITLGDRVLYGFSQEKCE